METLILKPNKETYALAAKILSAGGLVAFPTETVYGLGANALDENAAKKIYGVKGRPSDNPLIVHLANKQDIYKYCFVPPHAESFIDRFMPGAVTAVFKKNSLIPSTVTGGLDTVAVRIPQNEVARELIARAGLPICAPSANTSSRPSPTQAVHVYEDLNGKIPLIIDGGSCDIGIESTIVDFTGECPRLLRPGGVSLKEITDFIGEVEQKIHSDRPLCPGMKYKHYSPSAEVYLYENEEVVLRAMRDFDNSAVICYQGELTAVDSDKRIFFVKDNDEYAREVFAIFRQCDGNKINKIFCRVPDFCGIGSALLNRLVKASGSKTLEELYAKEND
ncbi:MAG: threonylcarbamoyl-AMP synthase [Clostridia bacterium]|nr:threonylcarbamoyl-AMP synthase [Clostridia bacterium]